MNLTTAAIGGAMLAAFIVFHFLGIFATVRAGLAFAGACLIAGAAAGAAGFNFVVVSVRWIEGLLSDLTAWLLGVRVGGAALVIVLAAIFIHDMHPKNKAGKRTGWAGLVLALVLIAGVAGIPGLQNIPADVRQGVTQVRSAVPGGH